MAAYVRIGSTPDVKMKEGEGTENWMFIRQGRFFLLIDVG